MNWNRFFLRLTTAASIILSVVVGVIKYSNSYNGASAWSLGVVTFICVWILYFVIKWVIKGLK
ncbi:MAG: hypothetical protein OXH00_02850 [Candidatus Poribacteria bacterium]|nr:hypothetical protein [Candidatus Poribacteria bacterium]